MQNTVAQFISARDGGVPSNPAHIFISSGSLRAITVHLQTIKTSAIILLIDYSSHRLEVIVTVLNYIL